MKDCIYQLESENQAVLGSVDRASSPVVRCSLKTPWKGKGPGALRWIASGGGLDVFGRCCPNLCSNKKETP